MKITLIVIGKTNKEFVSLIDAYCKKINHSISFEIQIVPASKTTKKTTIKIQKKGEGDHLLKILSQFDAVVLLDENGVEKTSMTFAKDLQNRMNRSTKQLAFVIGGAYGFSEEVYKTYNIKIALSRMTFSHQMVRLFFVEQLYRAFSILNNDPYHHE